MKRERRTAVAVASKRWPRRSAWPIVTIIVLASTIVFAVLMRTRTTSLASIPPARASTVETGPAFEDFIGADACAECHRPQHDAWRGSTHGRAGGLPGPSTLLRSFDGRPIRFRDAVVTPRTEAGTRHVFVIAWEGRPAKTFVVEGVVGGAHLVGGGTQGFLTRYGDGTLRFLPFELIRRENTWFCNTSTRLGRGWVAITDSLRLADCGDWPPVRVFGNLPRFANCQECHGSQIEIAAQPGQPGHTRYRSLTINCESCHGPGRRHVEIVRAGADTGADIGMRPLATLSKEASVAICLQCHALKDALAPGYLPGKPFDEFYSVKLPLTSDQPIFPDGRIRTFAYQQGHLYSDCYISGSMTCVDCHDPHSQGYRDADGLPLPGRFADAQCTSCHPSKAQRIEQHTRHPAESPGSRCVACHMPYLQQPEVGNTLRYARSDHTISIPRPAFDRALGVEVACQTCHRERDAASLQREVDARWGTLKPHPQIVAGLDRMRQQPSRALALELMQTDAGAHVLAEFTALSSFMIDHLQPDTPTLEREVVQRYERAALSDDPDLAGLGLAALHYARGNERRVRNIIVRRAGDLGAQEQAVRARWAVLLGFLADRHRDRGEAEAAIRTYRKALEVRPGDAATLLSLGLAQAQAQDYDAAEITYLESLRIDPENSLAWVNLGIARAARGNAFGAIEAYQNAIRVNPFDGLAHFNFGNLHLRSGRAEEAADHYREAIEREPGLAAAHFNLARAAAALGRLEEARDALRDGLEYEPANTGARGALQEIERSLESRSRVGRQ